MITLFRTDSVHLFEEQNRVYLETGSGRSWRKYGIKRSLFNEAGPDLEDFIEKNLSKFHKYK